MIRTLSAFALVGALLLASGQTSWAQAPAQAVKDRQEIMKKLFPEYYRDVARVAQGQSTDLNVVATKSAAASAELKKAAALFPAGTGREAVPTTRAKPEVWSQRADFEKAMTALIAETDAMAAAAKSGNVEAVKAQWPKLAEACGGCHGGPPKSGGKFRFEE
jgi:cytochrome c556